MVQVRPSLWTEPYTCGVRACLQEQVPVDSEVSDGVAKWACERICHQSHCGTWRTKDQHGQVRPNYRPLQLHLGKLSLCPLDHSQNVAAEDICLLQRPGLAENALAVQQAEPGRGGAVKEAGSHVPWSQWFNMKRRPLVPALYHQTRKRTVC